MLTPAIPCNLNPYNYELNFSLARQLVALQTAIPKLRSYYATLSPDTPSSPYRNPTFPYPTFYENEKEERIAFTYERPIQGLLFLCKLAVEAKLVCVKFVYGSYSKETHRACFALGFAPKLHAVQSIFGWSMVVMDYLDEEYSTLFDHIGRTPGVMQNNSKKLRNEIEKKIHELHNQDFVHGDIRTSNIMVKKDGFTTGKFMLLDYDWSGEVDIACYPGSLNKIRVRRPDTVKPGGKIEKEHDTDMIALMFV